MRAARCLAEPVEGCATQFFFFSRLIMQTVPARTKTFRSSALDNLSIHGEATYFNNGWFETDHCLCGG